MSELNKETALKFLSHVPEQNKFWCKDGNVLNNMDELQNSLSLMNADVFKFHVNNEKNDFSNWIYDVIGDAELANTLRKCRDKKTTIKRVKSRVNYLKTIVR